MALNMFTAGVVTRSKGQSIIARAAYNARERLTDERTGEEKDFRNRYGCEWSGIFAPKGAPQWVQDRGTLWNAVEEREDQSTRPDQAQLARDFKLALPHELNMEQRRWLVTDFARELSRKGMIVDVCIHAPDPHSDQRNYHAHMLVTMREIGPDGFGRKIRAWNTVKQLEAWKDRWSELGSRALARAGHDLEAERYAVGHKTLKFQLAEALKRGDIEHAQALDREPGIHVGAKGKAMGRDRGIETPKARDNRMIQERNEARNGAREYQGIKKPDFGRALGGIAEGAMDAVTSIFTPPVLTPEQKRAAEVAQIEREEAVRRQQEHDRDR